VLTASRPHRATSQTASQIMSALQVDRQTVRRVDAVLKSLRGRETGATRSKKKAG
jgi:hypothetical protein